jgi:hypothetical protein
MRLLNLLAIGTLVTFALVSTAKARTPARVKRGDLPAGQRELTGITGVGPSTAGFLARHGVCTIHSALRQQRNGSLRLPARTPRRLIERTLTRLAAEPNRRDLVASALGSRHAPPEDVADGAPRRKGIFPWGDRYFKTVMAGPVQRHLSRMLAAPRIERKGGEFSATLVHSRGKTVLGLGCKDGVSRISTEVKDRQGRTLQRFETRQIRHWSPSASGIIADVALQRHSVWIRGDRQIPGLLKRLGLRRGELAVGDVVTYEWHKMSDGSRFGQALVEDGQQRTKTVVSLPRRPAAR